MILISYQNVIHKKSYLKKVAFKIWGINSYLEILILIVSTTESVLILA